MTVEKLDLLPNKNEKDEIAVHVEPQNTNPSNNEEEAPLRSQTEVHENNKQLQPILSIPEQTADIYVDQCPTDH